MENDTPDIDPQETREWLDALAAVLQYEGPQRAHFLIEQMIAEARLAGTDLPISATTPYINTIPPDKEQRPNSNHELEHRIREVEEQIDHLRQVEARVRDMVDSLRVLAASGTRQPPAEATVEPTPRLELVHSVHIATVRDVA